MRIAIVSMHHETNTFALQRNDQLDARVRPGQEVIDQARTPNFLSGFLEVGREHGFTFVPTYHVGFPRGGLIEAHVFEHYLEMILCALREAGPVDGIYFPFHGAMVAEHPYTDAEGSLIAGCRKIVGPEVPFVATYDFHGIMTPEECANLAAAFPHDTNPHIDGYDRGREAAACMHRILRGEIEPVTRIVHVPIIGPNIGQSTWAHDPDQEVRLPLYQLNQRRAELEQTPGIVNLAIMGGYGYADTPHSCMSVIASADRDPHLAERLASELAAEVWAERERILNACPYVSLDEGVKQAMAHPEAPVVLVDLGDDPGSSCVADSPAVLESLIRHGARDCALTIRDPNVVNAAMARGVGATLSMEVGAVYDQRFYKPLKVEGTVKLIDDGNYPICGPTHGGWGREAQRDAPRWAKVGPRVVLRIGDRIDVIFSRGRTGKDRDFFKSAGVVFEAKKIFVVKSNQAHRASFDPVTAANINLASPGASTVNYPSLPFEQIPRPIWPIDRDFDWTPTSIGAEVRG